MGVMVFSTAGAETLCARPFGYFPGRVNNWKNTSSQG